MDSRTVGILGGGQLGRMLVAAASLLNVNVVILDSGAHVPAKQIVAPPPNTPHLAHIDGSFTDEAKIRQLASCSQVLTVEIEHVNADVLEEVQNSLGVEVNPSPQTIRLIQDKYLQKQHLQSHGIPVAGSIEIESSIKGIDIAATFLGLPLMLKSKTLAYDGRGNFVLTSLSQAQTALQALGNRPLYAERLVNLHKELAVMVVRSTSGEVRTYPVVETVHKDNICHLVFAPARTSKPHILRLARELAEKAVVSLSGAGVFGVEMFLLQDETLLVNEIAPRPHNSGHYTIEACNTSQYENHLRAILSLPLGSTDMKVPSAAMLNLLGFSSSMDEIHKIARVALGIPGASVHLYGKSECRKGRKMGHITLVANSDSDIRQNLQPILSLLPDSTPESITKYAPLLPVSRSGTSSENPLVGIIMGSDSDLPVMIAAARILDDFKVPYELSIVSAHRTPDRMHDYSKSAVSRGLRVLIAGAGGAAHLPGMVASMTALPVIGVPVKGSSLDGVDSLYSIVQMPRGIPVATVAINNSTNAALLAIRILGSQMPELCNAVEKYSNSLQSQVLDKIDRLESIGWEAYVNSK